MVVRSGPSAVGRRQSRGPSPVLRSGNNPSFCYATILAKRPRGPEPESRSVQLRASFVPQFLSRLKICGAARCETAPVVLLHGHADGNARPGIATIEEIISVVHIVDVHVVRVIPVISPVFRPRVHRAEPIAAVLKARVSSHDHERENADFEAMIPPEVSAEMLIGNEIPLITATLPPGTVIRLPVVRAMLLPATLLRMLKLRRVM